MKCFGNSFNFGNFRFLKKLRKSTVLECQQRFDSWFCSVFQMCQSRIDNGRIFKGCRSAFSCEEECKKYGADCYCCHGYKCNFKTTGMLHWFPYSAEFLGEPWVNKSKIKNINWFNSFMKKSINLYVLKNVLFRNCLGTAEFISDKVNTPAV